MNKKLQFLFTYATLLATNSWSQEKEKKQERGSNLNTSGNPTLRLNEYRLNNKETVYTPDSDSFGLKEDPRFGFNENIYDPYDKDKKKQTLNTEYSAQTLTDRVKTVNTGLSVKKINEIRASDTYQNAALELLGKNTFTSLFFLPETIPNQESVIGRLNYIHKSVNALEETPFSLESLRDEEIVELSEEGAAISLAMSDHYTMKAGIKEMSNRFNHSIIPDSIKNRTYHSLKNETAKKNTPGDTK